MNQAVFISDLHLHPQETAITRRFEQFIKWAAQHTTSVYILGDFFHVWPGDDALDVWSESIASQLRWLHDQGIKLYFMPGNRDFLVGNRFATRASLTIIKEPTTIALGDTQLLLVHGDRYCTKDKSHQWLRRLTRNRLFTTLFLQLPYALRSAIVNQVRQHSQMNRNKPAANMSITVSSMIKHMKALGVHTVIHGHVHQPGLTQHVENDSNYDQYVLSDWDDNPTIMCYNKASGFYFYLMPGA
jgi:UDP-2,3-diacylglucosamine hydrolase